MWIKWMPPLIVGAVLLTAAGFYGLQSSEEMSSEIKAAKPATDQGEGNPSTNVRNSEPNAMLQQIRERLPHTSITFHEGLLSLSLDKRRLDWLRGSFGLDTL
jgi:hypothetical protein